MQFASYGSIVGQLLAKRRVIQQVSQGEVAERVELAQSVISRMENGNMAISVTQLSRWASALDTSGSKVLAMADRATVALQERHGVRVICLRPTVAKRRKKLLKGAEVGALLTLSV